MKKIYKLTRQEIREKEKEFRRTAWGNEFWSGLILIDAMFIIYLVISCLEPNMGSFDDCFLWLLFFIFFSSNLILKFMYNNKLEEYIESEKETKEKSK